MLNKNDDIKMRKTVINGEEVFEVVVNGVVFYYKSIDEFPENIREAMQITLRNNLLAKNLGVEIIYKNNNSITIKENGNTRKFKNIEHVPEFYKKLILKTLNRKKAIDEKDSILEKYNNSMKINNEKDVFAEYVFDDKVVMVALILNPMWKMYLSIGIAIFIAILFILIVSINLKII